MMQDQAGALTASQLIKQMNLLREKRRTKGLSRRAFLKAWGWLKSQLYITPEWEMLRRAAATRAGGKCEYDCGGYGTQVHHKEQMSWNPDRTFDMSNVMWVCKSCHKEIHSS